MPLESELPRIDDRSHEQLMDEIRARIARYAPEWRPVWNDLNHSDPGITLAHVFAWLSEMLIFRMNKIPRLAQVKFLELLGIELEAAQPARAEIGFTVADWWNEPTVDVPAHTQVSASGDGPPIVFETARPLKAVALKLKRVQVDDGAQYDDRTEVNGASAQDAPGFEPFGAEPREGAALVLGFEPGAYANPEVFPPLTLDLAFFRADPVGLGRTQQCGPATARAYAPAKLAWEGWDGARWTELDLLGDETFALTQSGHMRVRVPEGNKLVQDYLGAYGEKDASGTVQPKLFWLRARLARTQYERAPRLLAVRTNTVPALQAQTVEREILGGANGRRNQKFKLANTPVIRGSVVIEIDQGIEEDRSWEVKDDLLGSGPGDRHLALNPATGELRAGDGEYGAIPTANPAKPDANVVAIRYQYGGGERGNVAAKTLNNLLTPVDGIDGGKTENLFAAAGGRAEESFDDAVRRAQKSLRARDRAVTADDYRHLIENFGEVRRAEVLPLAHPAFPGVKVPGTVSVLVVPESKSRAPMPSDALLREVCRHLDEHRPLTTELFVLAPRYVPVSLRLEVVAEDAADPGKVREEVEKALTRYLHPLEGGDDQKGWPFGGVLRYSKLLRQVLMVPGVDSAPRLRIFVDAEEQPEHSDVPLEGFAPHALVELRECKASVVPASEYEAATA